MSKKFITSALPYVNNQPHLGNIVGSVLSADVYSRYSRNIGDDVSFICGTDEFGTATEMEAIKQGIHPSEIVEKNRKLHKEVYDWFKIKFDIFGHTNSPEHVKITQDFFYKCYNNGFFSHSVIEQYYCNKCEQFLADRYVEGECSNCSYREAKGDQCDKCGRCLKVEDLKTPRCVLCSETPIMKSTEHLYLRLDLLQEKIKETFENVKKNWSQNAITIYNEWIGRKIHSRCMTRMLKYKWGVPVPLPGFEDKVFYVWFDAPIGYFTFLAKSRPDWKEWLNDAKIIQFMGKDNVPFHSIIFPGMILATKYLLRDEKKGIIEKKNDDNQEFNYPNINIINSTEYLQFNGEKFSKSRGIGIFGMDLVKKDLGCSDYWRFYLISRRPETSDSDFNIEDFILHVSSDLISNFGNFCNRVLKYISIKLNGYVLVKELDEVDNQFIESINLLFNEYKRAMDQIHLREGLQKVFEISSKGNKYLQDLQNNKSKMNHGFSLCYSLVIFIAKLIEPFTPDAANKLFNFYKIEKPILLDNFQIIKNAYFNDKIEILFSKFTEQQLANIKSYISKN